MKLATPRKIEYPDSDGKPMAETPYHMRVMIDTIEALNLRLARENETLRRELAALKQKLGQ